MILLELGGRVGSLEQDLEMAKAMIGRNAEALAKSLEEQHALEGELDQIHNIAYTCETESLALAEHQHARHPASGGPE